MADDPAPGAPPAEVRPPAFRPWGAWATAGLAATVLVVYAGLQLAAVRALAVFLATGGTPFAQVIDARFGLALWVSLLAAAPLAAGALFVLTALRRPPSPAAELGLVPARWRPALAWLAVALVVNGAYDALSAALDRPVVPDYLAHAYRTAGFLPGLVFAVVVAAPCFEELLFRGFLFAGLARSRLRAPGAVVVTAVAFAAIHVQYDLLDMGAILVLGLILGTARWRTGSTALTIGLHTAVNLTAMIETAWILRGGG
jgi:CAAX protease family protein